jgi:hypothetical protein
MARLDEEVSRLRGMVDTGAITDGRDLIGVEIDPRASLRVGGMAGVGLDADVVIAADVDLRNGLPQEPGWLLATVRPGRHDAIRVLDTDGSDVTGELLAVVGDEVRVRAAVTPLMMTRTIAATRADCLTYLLDRID